MINPMLLSPALKLLSTILCALLLAACASQTPSNLEPVVATAPPATVVVKPAPPAKPATRPFPADTLYALLVAEFAVRRNQFELGLANYLQQANKTRDPNVAAHTTRMARYLGADAAALEAALLWVQLEPEKKEARYSAAVQLTRAKRPYEAFSHMEVLHRLGGNTNFAAIAATTAQLPLQDQQLMLRNVGELAEQDSDNSDLLLAQAILAQAGKQSELALALVQQLLAMSPEHTQAILLEARILQSMDRAEEAFGRIESALAERPQDHQLRLQYARLLAAVDLAKAQQQFEILVEAKPEDGELLLGLAMLYRENKQYEEMRVQLNRLLKLGEQTSAAHYYLALDAEQNKQPEEAVEHYFSVQPSQMFASAIARALNLLNTDGKIEEARSRLDALSKQYPAQATRLTLMEADLLSQNDHLEEANEVLTSALNLSPKDPSLLYARSMVSEKRRDIDSLERDLRMMLELQPDSAMALNALGYSLANLTDRHQEALELISQALEIKPDDPAILDSMGWIHFRLGNLELALGYLQRAFSLLDDAEIAAHLGEVLWHLDRREEAQQIWKKSLEKNPDSAVLSATIDRIQASEQSNLSSEKPSSLPDSE